MANFDIASFNLINWANATPELYDSDPQLVDIIQKDANGNLFTKQVKNRGMIKKELWDDVGGALGQFIKNYVYVDQVNGDDNNDGSANAPFKSLTKVFSQQVTPRAGLTIVYLIGDYIVKASEEKLYLSGYKNVYLRGYSTGDERLILEYDTGTPLNVNNFSLLRLDLDVEFRNTTGETTIKNIIGIDIKGMVVLGYNYRKTINTGTKTNINVNYANDYISIYNRRSFLDYEYVDFTTNSNANIYFQTIGFTAWSNAIRVKIDGNAATVTDFKNKILNIVYDADSGNPTNFLFNYNVSN